MIRSGSQVASLSINNHLLSAGRHVRSVPVLAGASSSDDLDGDGIPAAIEGLLGSHGGTAATADGTNSLRSYVHRPTP